MDTDDSVSIPRELWDRLADYIDWASCDPTSSEEERSEAYTLLNDLHATLPMSDVVDA